MTKRVVLVNSIPHMSAAAISCSWTARRACSMPACTKRRCGRSALATTRKSSPRIAIDFRRLNFKNGCSGLQVKCGHLVPSGNKAAGIQRVLRCSGITQWSQARVVRRMTANAELILLTRAKRVNETVQFGVTEPECTAILNRKFVTRFAGQIFRVCDFGKTFSSRRLSLECAQEFCQYY